MTFIDTAQMRNNYPSHCDEYPDNDILILGISPGFASVKKSKTLERVRKWMDHCGISEEEYDWRNLVDEQGKTPRMSEIRLYRYAVANYKKVVCLGNLPAQWCKGMCIDHVLKVPHPSGLNRKWNDPTTEPQVMRELNEFINETI